jgi:hypothetical protein
MGPGLTAFPASNWYFTYNEGGSYLTQASSPTWGSDASYLKGWQWAGSGTANYRLVGCNFLVPMDYAYGGMTAYLLVGDDWSGTTTVDLHFAYQVYGSEHERGCCFSDGYNTADFDVTSVVNTVRRVNVGSIASADLLGGSEMVMAAVRYYNSSGSEKLLALGMEFEYEGYVGG